MKNKNQKMHVVTVDMGYGHQRAAYPLASVSTGGVINANQYKGISKKEERSWQEGRRWYEVISRFKKVPILGTIAFAVMDNFQKIEPFYPRRDLSKTSSQQRYFYKKVKQGLGRDLINALNKKPAPLVTTFFVPAYFAEYYNYQGPIYCVVCDADVARAWAPYDARHSKIIYLAPNKRVKERLQLYGVRASKIYVTGFPLPKENIGGLQQKVLKADLKRRICNLDPKGIYRHKYKNLIGEYLCPVSELRAKSKSVTITFAVGGAGAQREIGATLLRVLKKHIQAGRININLVAGVRNDIYTFFEQAVKKNGLSKASNVNILFAENKTNYFKVFNQALRTTDILWTKPSELTFYSGLGLPIIMAPPIGSQEDYNRDWLQALGAGIDSQDPEYVDEWLFDWLDSGWLAESAMQGYLDAPKMGTYHIENIVLHNKVQEIEDIQLL
jgi:hypothetical protein